MIYLDNGLLEVSGRSEATEVPALSLWLQVRDVEAEYTRVVERGAEGLRPPRQEFWGLVEAWIRDPDGVRIVLVQISEDHPLRQDRRTF